ncbi:NAD-dependent epimerase/dehydratase family protein [Companilactobacillus halodurans]|uniref:NAD-dependent epimerase/dehydratase family protein n=1 Tax=Companilactobacillus halodurans TaxID=2584183 RepID=A0A5P0ZXR1_9LACO|nr:NAD-dependent epimerase/dehydratase family protein [Companilactobacillus halodurans]MQS97514.1 NAD-dependent epimerase/dehydratase family protein [Companilactobacillus halodurans]
MNKENKIVVLGITGYMGSWLAKDLSDAGYKNIFGSFTNSKKAAALKDVLPDLNLVDIDVLSDNDKLTEIMQDAKWVFNDTAAFTGKEKTTTDYIVTKTMMANNVMQTIKQAGTVEKIVHLGSVGAIGSGHMNPEITEYDESDYSAIDPDNIWGVMKLAEERTVTQWCENLGINYVIVHPTNVIGPSFLAWNHDMIPAYLKNGNPMIDSQMDSVDVRDIAKLELTLMGNPDINNIRILGKGFTMMLSQLVQIVKEHLDDQQIKALFGKMTPIIDAQTALDVLDNAKDSNYYKENVNKINNTLDMHTKYQDAYQYQYTDAKETVIAALDKMLNDLK